MAHIRDGDLRESHAVYKAGLKKNKKTGSALGQILVQTVPPDIERFVTSTLI